MKRPDPLSVLLTSGARVRILRRLLLGPAREFYPRDLTRIESLSMGALSREMAKLARLGLVASRREGRRRYYRINRAHGLYRELKALFLKASLLTKRLSTFEGLRKRIRFAFVFGSVAAGDEDEQSDLDLMAIGSMSSRELYELLAGTEAVGLRPVNPVVYPEKEFRRRRRRGDSFVARVVDGPKIFLIGEEHEFEAFARRKEPAAS